VHFWQRVKLGDALLEPSPCGALDFFLGATRAQELSQFGNIVV
jgi:hypothetical protein